MTEPFSNPAVLPSLLWAKTVDLLSTQVSFIALVLPSFTHFLGDRTMEKLLLPARQAYERLHCAAVESAKKYMRV